MLMMNNTQNMSKHAPVCVVYWKPITSPPKCYICMCNITLLSTLLTSNLVRSHLVNPSRDWFVLQKPLGPEMDSCLFDHYSATMIIFASILHTICTAFSSTHGTRSKQFFGGPGYFLITEGNFCLTWAII